MYLIDAFSDVMYLKNAFHSRVVYLNDMVQYFMYVQSVILLHIVTGVKISPFSVSDASYFGLSSQTIQVCYFLLFVFHDICSHFHIHQA